MGLSVGELRQRAAADGYEASQIEDARDAKDTRSELIDLIMEQVSKAPPPGGSRCAPGGAFPAKRQESA